MPVKFRADGLSAAIITPMHADGSLNLSLIEPYFQRLVSLKVQNFYITGTSGEFPSLTVAERKEVLETWVTVAKKHSFKGKLIAHIGSACLKDSQELAIHAKKTGADAIAAVCPYYLVPIRVDSMLNYFVQLTSVVPDLPFYYYHFPASTKCPVNLITFLEQAVEKIPSFVGLKFTDRDMDLFVKATKVNGGSLQVMAGFDDTYADILQLGFRDTVFGSLSSMSGPFHRMNAIMDDATIENKTEKLEVEKKRVTDLMNLVTKYGLYGITACLKDLCKISGLDLGTHRAPLMSLSDEDVKNFKKDLEAIGYFEWNV